MANRVSTDNSRSASVNDPHADSDGDGLPNGIEEHGIAIESGDTFATDAAKADTDGDGLSDGEEAGVLVSDENEARVYLGTSDPESADTDDDGVLDGDEYLLGTNPWSDDTDDDGLGDEDELEFGSDPIVENPDDDDYSDVEERERGSGPLAHDKSGWRAAVDAGLKVLKFTLDGADKLTGGGKVKAVITAVKVARAAGVALPVIWDALRSLDFSDVDPGELVGGIFGDDTDEIGETLEGGEADYVAYVGRSPEGDLVYVGVTADFQQLHDDHGGVNILSVVGPEDPLPLNQARALAQAILAGVDDHSGERDVANGRSVIPTTSSLYGPAIIWGNHELDAADFEW